MITCARLNSSVRQDHGRIAAHLSKQARNDNQAAHPLVFVVGACEPAFLRLIEPPAALFLSATDTPSFAALSPNTFYSQAHPSFLSSNFARRAFIIVLAR
jgi:hypothetical protein